MATKDELEQENARLREQLRAAAGGWVHVTEPEAAALNVASCERALDKAEATVVSARAALDAARAELVRVESTWTPSDKVGSGAVTIARAN